MLFALNQGVGSLGLGSTLLSVLAYPNDSGKRENFAKALICGSVTEMNRDTDRFGEPTEVHRMMCDGRDHTATERMIKAGCRIIANERLIAAKMASPSFHAFLADKAGRQRPPIVPTHAGLDMLSQISIDLGDPGRPRDGRGRTPSGGAAELNKGNILSRCWTPSLPVLHLCIALALGIDRTPTLAEKKGTNIGDLLFDEDLLLWIIKFAEECGPMVAEKFNIDKTIMHDINMLRE